MGHHLLAYDSDADTIPWTPCAYGVILGNLACDAWNFVGDAKLRAVVFDGKLRFDPSYPDPIPADGECLVRVKLAGICATDLQILQGYMDFRGVIGHEMVGEVVQGPETWLGKRVACEINCVCRKCDMCARGLSNHCPNRSVIGICNRDGCFADLVSVPVNNLHEIPKVVSDEEAVFIEPLAAAFQVVNQCRVDGNTKVTVLGSGRLGLLVAQVLKERGCPLVVVGRNPSTLLLAEKKGIQSVHIDELVPKQDRDVVVDCTGSPEGFELALQLVRPRGTIVLKSTYAQTGDINMAPIVVNEIQVIGSRCGPFPEAISALARQAVEVRSMISGIFPIERAVEALSSSPKSNQLKVLIKF